MADWTNDALELFRSHAIDPDVASAVGVREEAGHLVYPTGKRRGFNGTGHLNQLGKQVKPWWVNGRDAGSAVLVTEGETDGLAATSALTATPSPFANLPALALPGCQYPPEKLAKGLAHYKVREAYIALDADDAGRKARDRIIRTLSARGIKPIPVTLPDGEDLASWLMAGGDLANLLADSEAAAEMARTGPSFADIADEPLGWLWRQRIPTRTLTVVAGDPEQGKSLFTCSLAADVSRAGKPVLMANAEDEPARIRERLRACEADLGQIRPVEHLSLPGDTQRLREQVAETGAQLVTIDPYNAFLEDHVSAVRDQQVRAALRPLIDIARDFDCAVVLVCHLNRESKDEAPIYRIPVGLRGVARSILSMERDEDCSRLKHIKSSYGDRQPAIAYRFDGARLVGMGGGNKGAPAQATAAHPSESRDGSSLILDYRQEYDEE